MSEENDTEAPARPVLRIVRGEPTAEELAALVAVISARSGAPAPGPAPIPSTWTDRSLLVRKHLHPGPGAWRASAWRA